MKSQRRQRAGGPGWRSERDGSDCANQVRVISLAPLLALRGRSKETAEMLKLKEKIDANQV